jgi:FG-GAP repeat protein
MTSRHPRPTRISRSVAVALSVLAISLGTALAGPHPGVAAAARPAGPFDSGPLPAGPGSTAFPDFNGDGLADMAVGTIFENIGGELDAGGVNVLYGTAAGLQAEAPDDQFWNQESPGVQGRAATGDHFGFCTQPGDFNADGYDDLAINIELEFVGVGNAGAVQVLYGGPNGLQADAPDDQLWSQNSTGIKDRAESKDAFGRALASADFNGDGYADLAIGVKGENPKPPPIGTAYGGRGIVQILYGGSNGLQADAPDDQVWSQDSPSVKDQAEGGDLFGRALGAGDYNTDGYGDLVVGAYDEKIASIREAGSVNVFYGSSVGLQADAPDDQFWFQGQDGMADLPEAGDVFGRAITSGDFNADGFDDVAVSARREGVDAVLEAGSVSVLYGSTGGLQADGVGGPDDQFWTQDSPGVEDQAEEGDWFGMTVVAADFNGDGFDDLAVGARIEDVDDVVDAGSANVLYGSATGLQADGLGAPDDQFWTQDSTGVQDQAEHGDWLGHSIAAADWNGDGFADLAVGALGEDLTSLPNAGGVNVLYATGTGLQADSPDDQFWTQDSPGVDDKVEPMDGFAWSLTGTTS